MHKYKQQRILSPRNYPDKVSEASKTRQRNCEDPLGEPGKALGELGQHDDHWRDPLGRAGSALGERDRRSASGTGARRAWASTTIWPLRSASEDRRSASDVDDEQWRSVRTVNGARKARFRRELDKREVEMKSSTRATQSPKEEQERIEE